MKRIQTKFVDKTKSAPNRRYELGYLPSDARISYHSVFILFTILRCELIISHRTVVCQIVSDN